MGITGRKKEIDALEKLYRSGKSEFVAIYGRRRVGKTFLVKEVFKERFTFCHTGLSPVEGKRNMMRISFRRFIIHCSGPGPMRRVLVRRHG